MGKFSDLEGVGIIPQFLPLNWNEWEDDEHVKQMAETTTAAR